MRNSIGSRLKKAAIASEQLSDRDDGTQEPRSKVLSVHLNAVALLFYIVASAGLGYLSWLLAARLMEPEEIGISAAAVSAAVLCSQLAVLGLASSIITFLPRELGNPAALLNGFFTIVVLSSVVFSGTFVLVAATFFDRLHILGTNLPLAASFISLAIATTVLLLLDDTSIAVRRADFALARGVLAGVVKLLVIVVAWVAALLSATVIVFAWVASMLSACLLGYVQLRKVFPGYRYRPQISSRTARTALQNGLSNHALTLAKFAPSWVIPLIVTEALSPAENAYWYGAWTIAFLVRFIPFATAQASFAEITNGAISLALGLRKSVWPTVLGSIIPTIVIIIFADTILSVMGEEYADAGTTPLRLLALGIFAQIAFELYVVSRRVTMRLAEPNLVFLANAAASIAAVLYGASVGGLVGVAIGWIVVDAITGVWAARQVLRVIT